MGRGTHKRRRPVTIGCTGDFGAVGSEFKLYSSVPVIRNVLAHAATMRNPQVYLHRISIPGIVARLGSATTPGDVIDELVMAFFLRSKDAPWFIAEPVRNTRDNLHFTCPGRRRPFFGTLLWMRRYPPMQLDVTIERLEQGITIDLQHSVRGMRTAELLCKTRKDVRSMIQMELTEFCDFLAECCHLNCPLCCVLLNGPESYRIKTL